MHALVAAFDDLYPNVAIEDIICKVSSTYMYTFFRIILILTLIEGNLVATDDNVYLLN